MEPSTQLKLALSALLAFCQQLALEGQLSFTQEAKLNQLIHDIKAVFNEQQ